LTHLRILLCRIAEEAGADGLLNTLVGLAARHNVELVTAANDMGWNIQLKNTPIHDSEQLLADILCAVQ
jgi:hypothetical protein